MKNLKVTHVDGNKFSVQEQLPNGRFGKSCKVELPSELMQGKDFAEVMELVRIYVTEGRQLQNEFTAIQKANGQPTKVPEVFDEDSEVQDEIVVSMDWVRLGKFAAAASMAIGFVL